MYEKAKFEQDGSIVRLKFENFMQYSDTEFLMGPNLNVIIGPNGSGKSTIVNGICIGLAGKLSVLGRASNLADYILVGQDKAMIEVELFSGKGKNLVITRRWNTTGKSVWTLNGNKCTEKEVKERVAKLRIQVDNLCQFLPQDKVHDFSGLNNKGLLDSTIDAVGNTNLKEKHGELKQLQKEILQGADVYDRKVKILDEKKVQFLKMEEDVKAFKEKEKLIQRTEMLSKKRIWSTFEESRVKCYEDKQSFLASKKKLESQEEVVNPLKIEVSKWKRTVEKTEHVLKTENDIIKDSANRSRFQCNQVEDMKQRLVDIDDQTCAVQRRIKEKKANVEKYKRNIRELEADIAKNVQDDSLASKLNESKKNTAKALNKVQSEKEKIETKRSEVNEAQVEVSRVESKLQLLHNVDAKKINLLKEKSPEAYEALQWLRNNKNNFEGNVYEPFIVCGNVQNADHALYIENTINLRDLLIFFFEKTEDMNIFLNQTRSVMRLEKIGAAVVPKADVSMYTAQVPAETLKQYGLTSYLKEMVNAPPPVLAFMCHQYNLHNTAVFDAKSEKYNDIIVNKHHLRRYFFGNKGQNVSKSSYSGNVTTKTTEIRPLRILGVGQDQEEMKRVKQALANARRQKEILVKEIEGLEYNCQQFNVELEAHRMQQREMEQIKNLVTKNTAAIERNRRQLRDALSNEEEEHELQELAKTKITVLEDMIQTTRILKVAIEEGAQARLKKDVKVLKIAPIKKKISTAEERIEVLREEMKDLKLEVETKDAALKVSQGKMMDDLKAAKKSTGLAKGTKDKPPPEVVEFWTQEGFPNTVLDIDRLAGQLEAAAHCAQNVNQSVLEEYRELKFSIEELEQETIRCGKEKANQIKRIEAVKNEWLGSLTKLVKEINDRFSHFFGVMGFAGEVNLHRGCHENDFDNYGIKIMVKYRDHETLQELTPHRQSGGERSVATAIYMLALQALTTVPFRCVDEINQGMDMRNERLVFELLVETSCNENDAQYFLLTPKLLTGLDYNPKMSVLVVHNGYHMSHYSQWDMDAFIKKVVQS